MTEAPAPPKRHHYVPQAYLKAFCDRHGKIRVYRKDDPGQPIVTTPANTMLQRYYYSQPADDGTMDHGRLEAAFSEEESKWPPLVTALRERERLDADAVMDLFRFIGLQRVRVPAMRDAIEKIRAFQVKTTTKILEAAGKLPAKPPGLDVDSLIVSIDPHQSLLALPTLLKGVGVVLDRIGIGCVHNTSDSPFLSSDNPVIWFNPTVPDEQMRPYTISPGDPLVFLFPIAPDLLIFGHSDKREQFAQDGLAHRDLGDREMVESMNCLICRFGYQAVIAREAGHESMIQRYASLSPVVTASTVPTPQGTLMLFENEFGPRQAKPKWSSPEVPSG